MIMKSDEYFLISITIVSFVANLGSIPAEIEINIYNIVDRKVRTLLNERRYARKYNVVWDGSNDLAKEVLSGGYFVR